MKVLLSIKPEYAEKILTGEKRYEFRKVMFKNPNVKTVVIYSTMPVGKVVGEFDVGGIIVEHPDSLWDRTSNTSGITQQFFDEYFNGRQKAYAIKVKKPRRYKTPMDLKSVITSGCAPQSFCYLS